MCFGCSKEPSHRDGSFEYPQHMFWMSNKKNNFQVRTPIWGGLVKQQTHYDKNRHDKQSNRPDDCLTGQIRKHYLKNQAYIKLTHKMRPT